MITLNLGAKKEAIFNLFIFFRFLNNPYNIRIKFIKDHYLTNKSIIQITKEIPQDISKKVTNLLVLS